VTNAVLPIMRGQRSGRILNVGSGLGLIPAPYSAYYSANKHAIEGYSESLDHEVREFGVRVAIIEPAATRTPFEASTIQSDTPLAAYDASRAKYLVAYERAMAVADTAESVAETMCGRRAIKLRAYATRLARPRGRSHSPGALFLGPCSTRFCGRNSGWRNQHVYWRAKREPCHPAEYPSHLGIFGPSRTMEKTMASSVTNLGRGVRYCSSRPRPMVAELQKPF